LTAKYSEWKASTVDFKSKTKIESKKIGNEIFMLGKPTVGKNQGKKQKCYNFTESFSNI
jgi:hypothetical protein